MTTNGTTQEHDYSIVWKFLVVLSYASIVFLISYAGFLISHRNQISWSSLSSLPGSLIMYAIFYVPIYIYRVSLYEFRPSEGELRASIRLGSQFAIVFAIVTTIVFVIIIALHKPDVALFARLAGFGAISIAPYLVFVLWRNRHAADIIAEKQDIDASPIYNFRFKTLFPALFTGIPPFIYGWTLTQDFYATLRAVFLIAVLLLVSLYLAVKKNAIYLLVFALVMFCALLFVSILYGFYGWKYGDIVPVILFSGLMILTMGVFESWYAAKRVESGEEVFSANTTTYHNGTNVATSILLCAFFTTLLFHPGNFNRYFVVLIAISTVSYLFWFALGTYPSLRFWNLVRLGFGYAVPVIVIISHDATAQAFSQHNWANFLFMMFSLATIATLWQIRTFFQEKKLRKAKIYSIEFYESLNVCLPITGTCSFFLAVLLGGYRLWVGNTDALTNEKYVELAYKLDYILVLYLLLVMATTIALGFICENLLQELGEWLAPKRDKSRSSVEKEKEYSSSATRGMLSTLWHDLYYAAVSARPVTAMVAGLVTYFFVATVEAFGPAKAVVLAFPMVFITAMGFILNDIGDLAKDIAAGKRRPITVGLLPVWKAAVACSVLYVGAGVVVVLYAGSFAAAVISATAVFVFIYTPIAKRMPIAKNVLTAIMCIAPMQYGAAIACFTLPWQLYIAVMLFIVGREILIDTTLDRETDAKSSLITLAILLGHRRAIAAAWLLMFIAFFFLAQVITTWLGTMLTIIAVLVALLALILSARNVSMHVPIKILLLVPVIASSAIASQVA